MTEMTSSRPYLLRSIRQWIIDNRLTPYILVQLGLPETSVPEAYASGDRIVLNLGEMAVSNLEMANDFLTFSARFEGRAMPVIIPTDAVLAIYARENGQGMVFDRTETTDGLPRTGNVAGQQSSRMTTRKPHLELIKS